MLASISLENLIVSSSGLIGSAAENPRFLKKKPENEITGKLLFFQSSTPLPPHTRLERLLLIELLSKIFSSQHFWKTNKTNEDNK